MSLVPQLPPDRFVASGRQMFGQTHFIRTSRAPLGNIPCFPSNIACYTMLSRILKMLIRNSRIAHIRTAIEGSPPFVTTSPQGNASSVEQLLAKVPGLVAEINNLTPLCHNMTSRSVSELFLRLLESFMSLQSSLQYKDWPRAEMLTLNFCYRSCGTEFCS